MLHAFGDRDQLPAGPLYFVAFALGARFGVQVENAGAIDMHLAPVDLVEHLHEHEHVEHHGEMDLRVGALAQIRSDGNIKETMAKIKKNIHVQK